jgi:methionyl-tRNA synthetase
MSKLYSFDVNCPVCGKSMMDPYNLINGKPSIRLNAKTSTTEGVIRLCSLYGCYEHQTSMDLPEGEIVEFSCPICHTQLVKQEACETCGAPMVPLSLEIGGKVYFCSRKGCKAHNVAFEDLSHALHLMYNKFGFAP